MGENWGASTFSFDCGEFGRAWWESRNKKCVKFQHQRGLQPTLFNVHSGHRLTCFWETFAVCWRVRFLGTLKSIPVNGQGSLLIDQAQWSLLIDQALWTHLSVVCRLLWRFGTTFGEAGENILWHFLWNRPATFCPVFSISRVVVCQNFRHCRLSIFEVASFVSNWWFKNGESTWQSKHRRKLFRLVLNGLPGLHSFQRNNLQRLWTSFDLVGRDLLTSVIELAFTVSHPLAF